MEQKRVKFTGAEEENKADQGGTRDQKIPTQKTQSFKETKKAQNWFQRQISRNMSHDYDSIEMEQATAVAAAAFAINSEEVSEIPQEKEITEPGETSLTKTKSKVHDTKSPFSKPAVSSKRFSGSFKSANDQGNKVPISSVTEEKKPEKAITPAPSLKKTSTFGETSKNTDDKKPKTPAPGKTPTFGDKNLMNTTGDIKPESPAPKVPPPPVHQPVSLRPPPTPSPISQTSTTKPSPVRPPTSPNGTRGQTLTKAGPYESKADAWERNELQKIKKRYEDLIETIDTWEKRKKMRARRKLNKQEQSENERKRGKALNKYQSKMKYIDEIAGGARAEAFERRRNEELKAKEKANIIRTTGKLPRTCFCC